MELFRYLLYGVLGACGGLLGNLLAAIVQSSIGRFTQFQAVSMIAGIIVVIVLSYRFQPREKLSYEVDKLHRNLAEHRNELHRLLDKAQSGEIWRLQDVQAWEHHERSIVAVKTQLDKRSETYPYDRIDALPPPEVSYLVKTAGLVKQVSVALVVPLVVAFGISFYASTFVHTAYLAIRPRPASTVVVVVISPHPEVTATLAATGTVLVQPIETPVASLLATPTDSPVTPTPVVVVVAPTATPRSVPAATIAPATNTPPPLASTPRPPTPTVPEVSPTVNSPQPLLPEEGQVFGSQDSVELRWSDAISSQGFHYLLVVEHNSGASFIVTDETVWMTPGWLREFQPIEGIKWWVALCRGEVPVGEYPTNPCEPTIAPSAVRRFGWTQTFDSPLPSPPACTECLQT